MQKITRLLAIEKIISEESISSQDELLRKLKGVGISCTQATLSRNLRQLGVIRIPSDRGGYKYLLSEKLKQSDGTGSGLNLLSVIKSITDARGMVVLKTVPGHASSTAFVIDSTGRYEIAGTIAGDDTLLIIPRDNISLSQIHSCLEMIFPGFNEKIGRD
ncbi:MAG: arginine repressor [Odoribacter sp.]|nr:arginine repressor [Odoribacter sp.]